MQLVSISPLSHETFFWQAPQDTQSAAGLAWKNGSRRQGPAPRTGAAPRVAPVKWCNKSWDVGENRRLSNLSSIHQNTKKNQHTKHILASGEFILSTVFDFFAKWQRFFRCRMFQLQYQNAKSTAFRISRLSNSRFLHRGPHRSWKGWKAWHQIHQHLRYIHPKIIQTQNQQKFFGEEIGETNLTTPHLAELLTGKTSRIPDSLHWKAGT